MPEDLPYLTPLDEIETTTELTELIGGPGWFERLVDVVQTVAMVAIAVALAI